MAFDDFRGERHQLGRCAPAKPVAQDDARRRLPGPIFNYIDGAADDEGALLVGASNTVGSTDTNWLSLARTGTALTRLANYAGGAAVAVLFDARTADRYFVADGSKLWTNVNSTTSTNAAQVFHRAIRSGKLSTSSGTKISSTSGQASNLRSVRERIGVPSSRRNEPSLSSASTTIQSLAPRRAFEP